MAEAGISAEVRAFLESMKVPGILSTLGRHGEPISSAVWFGFVEDDILVSTPAGRNKARNVRGDGRVSFIVDTKEMPYRGVAIEGVAEVLEDPDGMLVRRVMHRYLGPELPQATISRLEQAQRVAFRIKARRVRPWNIGAAR